MEKGSMTKRLTVQEHYSFRANAPEEFKWSLVLNDKQATLALKIAAAIKTELDQDDASPYVPGLREALRILAAEAVWRVVHGAEQSVVESRPFRAAA